MSPDVLACVAGACAGGGGLAALIATAPGRFGSTRTRALEPRHGSGSVPDDNRPAGPMAGHPPRPGPGLARRIGTALRRHAGAPADDAAAAMVGSVLLIAGPIALVDLRLAVIVGLAIRIRPILIHRRRRLELEDRVIDELPEVIDLVRLGLASGGSNLVALQAVAARPAGPVTDALAAVVAQVAAGHRMADALEDLPGVLGEPIRSLVRALVSAERYGVELGPTLDRLADEARDDRRRRAQTRARRVPVQMLLPLVVCILPAFVVLTLVPTLVSTFETLEL